jgi:hypothetical protein
VACGLPNHARLQGLPYLEKFFSERARWKNCDAVRILSVRKLRHSRYRFTSGHIRNSAPLNLLRKSAHLNFNRVILRRPRANIVNTATLVGWEIEQLFPVHRCDIFGGRRHLSNRESHRPELVTKADHAAVKSQSAASFSCKKPNSIVSRR